METKNKDLRFLRRSKIADSLELCETDSQKIEILLDKVVQLQDCIIELQQQYINAVNSVRKLCVQVPF